MQGKVEIVNFMQECGMLGYFGNDAEFLFETLWKWWDVRKDFPRVVSREYS